MTNAEQIRAFVNNGGERKEACLRFGVTRQRIGQIMSPIKQASRTIFAQWLRKHPEARPDKCHDCKRTAKVEAHHEDYYQPFQVDWLCKKCHMKRHVQNGIQDLDEAEKTFSPADEAAFRKISKESSRLIL